MAGQKMSAKAMEEFEFMESLVKQCGHLLGETEKYAGSTGNSAQQIFQGITRALGHIRQKAMMKNLGPLADAAGVMAIGANRGSPIQRARFLREQLATFKTNVERTMKALVAADAREKAENEKTMAKRKTDLSAS